jgi:hypothetical protein
MAPSPDFSSIGTKWQVFVVFGIIGVIVLGLQVLLGVVAGILVASGVNTFLTRRSGGNVCTRLCDAEFALCLNDPNNTQSECQRLYKSCTKQC